MIYTKNGSIPYKKKTPKKPKFYVSPDGVASRKLTTRKRKEVPHV